MYISCENQSAGLQSLRSFTLYPNSSCFRQLEQMGEMEAQGGRTLSDLLQKVSWSDIKALWPAHGAHIQPQALSKHVIAHHLSSLVPDE